MFNKTPQLGKKKKLYQINQNCDTCIKRKKLGCISLAWALYGFPGITMWVIHPPLFFFYESHIKIN